MKLCFAGGKKAFLLCLFVLFSSACAPVNSERSDSERKNNTPPASYADVYSSSYAASSANGVGVAASVHPLATQAALAVFDKGGNAIDAAIAAAFTLGVVDSHNSGIGGGSFALIHWADGSVEAIDGREMAPAGAHRNMYLRDGKVQTAWSKTGALASGIPGSVALYHSMHQRGAKLSWRELIEPAAQLATEGFPLGQVSIDRMTRSQKSLRQFPESARILLDPQGQPWPLGHHLKQADLAKTYRQLADKGPDYFYRGEFAQAVERWMRANQGIITADDFANYRLIKREPVISRYREHTIYGFPPPSSGGVHVAQILNILEHFDLAALSSVERKHLLAEAMKRAFADRAHYLGDADFVPVPKGLTDKAYAKQLAESIDRERASTKVEHGVPPNFDKNLFGKHTTHFSTADKYGNWVAITTTVNTSFGSKVIIPGTGVVMNNQMDDFSIQPGVPNAFGLVGNEANSIAAGKRPLSSMSPTLVSKNGQALMALGAAGGPTIISQVVQALINTLDLGMNAEQALAAPRLHHQWKPDTLMVEKSLSLELQEALKAMGHPLYISRYSGSSQLIMRTAKGFDAASEPRIIARNAVAAMAADKQSALSAQGVNKDP